MSSEGLGDQVHKVVCWSSPPQEWQRYSSWFTKGLVNMIKCNSELIEKI